jgi:hypothetical protein
MSRCGWKSMAMVVRYEHASEERDALLARALNPYQTAEMWCRSGSSSNPIAHVARTTTLRWQVRCGTYRR